MSFLFRSRGDLLRRLLGFVEEIVGCVRRQKVAFAVKFFLFSRVNIERF